MASHQVEDRRGAAADQQLAAPRRPASRSWSPVDWSGQREGPSDELRPFGSIDELRRPTGVAAQFQAASTTRIARRAARGAGSELPAPPVRAIRRASASGRREIVGGECLHVGRTDRHDAQLVDACVSSTRGSPESAGRIRRMAGPVKSIPASFGMSAIAGPYSMTGGHHIHQSAAFAPAGARSAGGNPNHDDAISIAQDVPGFTTDQHDLASASQRNINRGQNGLVVNQPQVGGVSIGASGDGTNAGTPSQTFEDLKAYYSLLAAGMSPEEAFQLVQQSAQQIEQAGLQPGRVPSR
jgi:hypothetical protein